MPLGTKPSLAILVGSSIKLGHYPRGLFYEHVATGWRHSPEQQNEQNAEEAQEPEAAERVHVGEQRRLLDQNVVGAGHRLPRRRHGPQARGEERLLGGEEFAIGGLIRREVPDHEGLVYLWASAKTGADCPWG